ncbi:MAG TPA: flagellar motor protein MotA [Aestuariivirga sp.]|nr:flagellar motor protein MotA [Aestuariivirga sp.]
MMAYSPDTARLEAPKIHLVHMVVFVLVVGVIAAVLYPTIQRAFMANPGLNGLIIGIGILGILYAFRMVWRLFPEVRWVNGFRLGQANEEPPPVLLGPMATLLGNQTQTILSPASMRSLLDSLASRLDEARDLMRYLVGLLIFLGLLGTFWGLLETMSSVGAAIQNLDVSSGQSGSVFTELKQGLQKPLSGMGISFSSSLFGLAGSLILGFLDLKASQAQNRFYHNLEDWLSTITDIQAGDGATPSYPGLARFDMQNLQRSVDRLTQAVEQGGGTAGTARPAEAAMGELADAVASLVQQMREEQKMMRHWVQSQQAETQRLLGQLSAPAGRGRRPGDSD